MEARKTVALCRCDMRSAQLLPWDKCRVFPLGAVPKPLEPTEVRIISDHTRSGLKEVTNDEHLKHTLDTYTEIEGFFLHRWVMRMMDVKGAFPLLPLAPALWVYFLCWWYTVSDTGDRDEMWLYAHLTGDFTVSFLSATRDREAGPSGARLHRYHFIPRYRGQSTTAHTVTESLFYQ